MIFHSRMSLFIWVGAARGLRGTAVGSWSISGAWDVFGLAVLGQFEDREDSALRSAVLIPGLAMAPSGPVALSRCQGLCTSFQACEMQMAAPPLQRREVSVKQRVWSCFLLSARACGELAELRSLCSAYRLQRAQAVCLSAGQ